MAGNKKKTMALLKYFLRKLFLFIERELIDLLILNIMSVKYKKGINNKNKALLKWALKIINPIKENNECIKYKIKTASGCFIFLFKSWWCKCFL